jgi:hypothetical protein
LIVTLATAPRAEDDRDEADRQHDDREPRQYHRAGELGAGQGLVREHDQIRQIRSGQKQRSPVGHEQRAVQERTLVAVALPGGVQHDRRQKDHGRIEVQDGGDDCLQAEQRGKEHDRPAADPLDPGAERRKHAFVFDDGAKPAGQRPRSQFPQPRP